MLTAPSQGAKATEGDPEADHDEIGDLADQEAAGEETLPKEEESQAKNPNSNNVLPAPRYASKNAVPTLHTCQEDDD